MTFPWLTVLGLVPIIGSLLPFLLKGKAGKASGLVIAVATLVIAIAAATQFSFGRGGYQLAEQVPWIQQFGAYYSLGVDGLALIMVLMVVVLVPIVLIAEWSLSDSVGRRPGNVFFGLVLLLEGLSLFVFTATDVLLFYLFFEATLLPVYFLIGEFGGPKRKRAAIKFLLYSLAGGLVMLASVIGIYAVSAGNGRPTYLLADLIQQPITGEVGRWLMIGFLIAFIIKAPMVPVHTWLPEACESATPGTSTLLVGVLDKIGTFGMIRFCLGLFPEASQWATPFMLVLALISIIYGGLAAIGQKNLLRMVAFTSVSHFGFIVLGIYALTSQSLTGSMFYMLNHGFSTAALFLVVGMMIKRRGSADIDAFGGLQKLAPVLSGLVLLAGLATVALPGMSSFVSEFLVISGAWQRYPWVAAISTLGMILAAIYVFNFYQRTMTGKVTDQVREHVKSDASAVERLIMVPIMIVILVLGFFPKPALDVLAPSATQVMQQVGVTDPQPQAGKEGK